MGAHAERPLKDPLRDAADAAQNERDRFRLRAHERLSTHIGGREAEHALTMMAAAARRLEPERWHLTALAVAEHGEFLQRVRVEINRVCVELDLNGDLAIRPWFVWRQQGGTDSHAPLGILLRQGLGRSCAFLGALGLSSHAP